MYKKVAMHKIFSQVTNDKRSVTIFQNGKITVKQTPDNDRVWIHNGTFGSTSLSTEEWNTLAKTKLRVPTFAEWRAYWETLATSRKKAEKK